MIQFRLLLGKVRVVFGGDAHFACHESGLSPPTWFKVHVVGRWQFVPLLAIGNPLRGMVGFLLCVFSSRRPQNVARMKGHIGNDAGKVRWLVGTGEKMKYMKAGASNVVEVGDLYQVMAFGINLANTSHTPVVLISDDIRGFYAFVGSPATWTSPWHGAQLAVGDFTRRILAAMRQVEAPLGGVACSSNARMQLQAPEVSYHHFFTMDFMVMDPPINFPVDFHPDVQHKLDYHIIASALAAVGAVCRLNRFSIDAPHNTAGGAGNGAARLESDRRACRWLQRRWGRDAFRRNAARDGQVVLRGCQLVGRADGRLPALHNMLYAASVPTKRPGIDSSGVRAAVGAGAPGRPGRQSSGRFAMTAAQRQRLRRARAALKEVVHETRMALDGESAAVGASQQSSKSSRALSANERQEVCRARRRMSL